MEDKAKKAPKARIVDNFMATGGNVNQFSIEGSVGKECDEPIGDCTAW